MRSRRRAARGLITAVAVILALAGCGRAERAAPDASVFPATSAAPATPTDPAPLGTTADALPAALVTLTRTDGTEATVAVRVAATPDARAQGLMGVAELPVGNGMLFVFPEVASHGGFWMRGTLVPLDIAFAAAGEVVAVATMTPCAADPCPITRPGRPYDAALEVPAGWLAAQGVGPGATLRIRTGEPSQ